MTYEESVSFEREELNFWKRNLETLIDETQQSQGSSLFVNVGGGVISGADF